MEKRRTRKRIVRLAAVALAGVVLLVSGYVSSYGAMWWYFGHNNANGASSPAWDFAAQVYDVFYTPLV